MNETLRVIIIDDEYHARKLLSEYVSKLPFLELAGTGANVFEAMEILRKEKIDILLSDIQMPEITGLEFVRSLKNPPVVIFTTAYSEYAVESYELDVADYLLKPIAFPRFLQAINRVIEKRENNSFHNPLFTAEYRLPHNQEEDSMVVKSGYKLYKINYADLLYVEGQREYVTFHTTKQNITTLFSLKDLEEKLPSGLFVRIHKSYIISIKHIELIDKNIVHIAGKKLPVGSSYKDNLMKLFE
ncbi:DNA-binding LytR/AlgR family response regulator [Dysgonomonas hofstadii]|uniref:DNA-binding LytR/AlgR family response regulator n=1 Tax=Dysgonomonas hofstadii TaxID=637886 RepID=A0A840CKT5_9BACT|nr:LytTR family DNA-binding domain-containing protein [Dysgonomonas hofstadii]MBB4035771.1 DNA-binding LytR/AlgR family response regulator [Dysgonomonas hofstadii]